MGKMNLAEQLRRSIDFKPGTKKRETKANIRSNLKAAGMDPKKTQDWRVYSKGSAKALFQTASQFGRYAQHELGVKQARDLRLEHAQAFLEDRRKEGCTASTLKNYADRLRHLSLCINHTYRSANIDFSELTVPNAPKAQEREQMTQEQFNAVMDCMPESRSKDAARLARSFALRVGSTTRFRARDVDFEKNLFTVYRDKDGRTRVLPIETEAQRKLLTRLSAGKKPYDKLIDLKQGSVNKTFRRAMVRSGVCQNLLDQKTNIHSVRKLTSQERYNEHRKEGYSAKQAAGNVTEYLGHGRHREDLTKIYIKNRG